MHIVFALLVAVGLALAWQALMAPPTPKPVPDPARPDPPLVRLAAWLRRSSLIVTPWRFLGGSVLACAGLALVALLATGSLILAAAASLATAATIRAGVERLATTSTRQSLLELEMAVTHLQGLLQTQHLGVTQAIADLARHGPVRLRPVFAEVSSIARLPDGGGLAAGLTRLREAVGTEADDLADALTTADEVGAERLPLVLDQLAASLRGQRLTEEAIATAQHRLLLQARFLVVAPVALFVLMRAATPAAMAVYDTPGGSLWLTVVALLLGVGYILTLRLGRVARPPRARRST